MTVVPNTWQLFTLRWDGSTLSIFADGKLQAAVPYTAIGNTGLSYHGSLPLVIGVLAIGGRSTANSAERSATYSFSTALAEPEIAAAYTAKAPVANARSHAAEKH